MGSIQSVHSTCLSTQCLQETFPALQRAVGYNQTVTWLICEVFDMLSKQAPYDLLS